MDLKEKVLRALGRAFTGAYVRVEADDGISGFVVSPQFDGMSALDRQTLIDDALARASDLLSQDEQRQVLMIAGITPTEFDSVGPRIRVHKVKEMAGGAMEVLLHGRLADAEYVRGTLNSQKGIKTTDPKESPGAAGILMSFRVKGTESSPLTKTKALRVLKADPYIEVMPNA